MAVAWAHESSGATYTVAFLALIQNMMLGTFYLFQYLFLVL